MKITPSIVFEVLRYWIKNGKTMTALITGFAVIALREAGMEEHTPEAVEFITLLVATGVGIFGGVFHKIVKFIQAKKEEANASENG